MEHLEHIEHIKRLEDELELQGQVDELRDEVKIIPVMMKADVEGELGLQVKVDRSVSPLRARRLLGQHTELANAIFKLKAEQRKELSGVSTIVS